MTDDKNRQAPTDQEGAPSADQEKEQKKTIIVDTPKRGHRAEEIAEYLKTDEGKAAVESLKETIINVSDVVGPAIKALQEPLKIAESITSAVQRVREIQFDISKIVQAMMQANISTWAPAELDFEALEKFYTEIEELTPYLEAEIKKYPEYEGKSYTDLIDELPFSALPDLITAATDTGTNTEEPAETEPAEGEEIDPEEEERIHQIITDLLTIRDAARAAKAAAAVIGAQQAGRNQRRQVKENAKRIGAIMGLQTGNLVTFSERDLWDAFAPGKISKIGTLTQDKIDDKTGQVTKSILEKGEIMPVSAIEVSYKALFLLNTILANSVENYRERFVKDGAITFYVKGVLDQLEIDPRIKDDGQLDINRKTAGVIYLEKQFVPLLQFIGTIPGGSRYSVFSYDGYDADTDTMTVRIPYLFQLWKRTQTAFAQRKAEKQKRIDEGKRPLKKDLTPLEVNALFKPTAFKEEDTVLEIAAYITNVMLNAGAGAHKTDITFKTLIKNCPRLRERLDAIESIPKGALQENGKRINKTARYNSELRKIARAYSLIMNADKCDAVRYFYFESFMPTKENGHSREFIPPTKSTIDGKISIKWHKIDPEN